MSNPLEQFSRMRRLPPYVFTQVNELKMQKRWAGDDIVDLGMGNPDMATPQHIVDKLIEAAGKGHNHRYSASRGITKLREAIAAWYKRRYDVELDPDSETVVTRVQEKAFPGRTFDLPAGYQPKLSINIR